MKKIKWLLLIWFLCTLFSTCFWYDIWFDYNIWYYNKYINYNWFWSSPYYYKYFSFNNNQFVSHNWTYWNFSVCGTWNCNTPFNTNWSSNWQFFIGPYGTDPWFYYWSDYLSLYTFDWSQWTITNFLDSNNYSTNTWFRSIQDFYVRILLDSWNVNNSWFAQWLYSWDVIWWVTWNKYQILFKSWTSIINWYNIADCLISNWTQISFCNKSLFAPWYFNEYSFVYWWESYNIISNWNFWTGVWFRSILNWLYTWSFAYIWAFENWYDTWLSLDNVLITSVNNYWVVSTTPYLLVFSISWTIDSWYIEFWFYSCSSDVNSCTFLKWWILEEIDTSIRVVYCNVQNYNFSKFFFFNWLHWDCNVSYWNRILTYYEESSNTIYLSRNSLSSTLSIDLKNYSNNRDYDILSRYFTTNNWWGWNLYTSTWSITFSGCIDTQVCTYSSWDNWNVIKICHSECVSQEVINSWGYISYNWNYYFVDTPLSLDDLKNSGLEYSTWYLDSWGILNPVYFEDLFDPSKKAVWICPFPYYPWPLDFLSKIWTDWVYLFMPLICFYSAFQHWSHLSYFDNPEIISWGVLTSSLLNWNSENHRILFMFLDILLSIGLLWLFHHLSSLL